ncbi:MAG: PEP-CTERM sorting domain-containing protein [Desulfuromonadaceae bacterium]|nr:PEP-CTERM sorting domain-containing protein [Desulfuromonadaceae bacterium]MDD5106854.1 PEP-CTERM sorting domain-containing protein [Desulfuromonadaceae bacterium]
MKKHMVALLAGAMLIMATCVAGASTIINNSTSGYYNSSIGTMLDNTSLYFPGANISTGDPTYNNMSPAPDLSAASSVLGSWLSSPQSLNSYWSTAPVAIPLSWRINTEDAIIYKFNAGSTGLNNVSAQFGVDNGLYVWLDGTYLNGWMAPGGVGTYEYSQAIGSLSAGDHYLQVLREDHGGSDGFTILVQGETAPVPEPGTIALLGLGMAGLALYGKRRQNKA